jgi:hypothetical protein
MARPQGLAEFWRRLWAHRICCHELISPPQDGAMNESTPRSSFLAAKSRPLDQGSIGMPEQRSGERWGLQMVMAPAGSRT